MPAAKTHRGRLAQVERWLRARFPAPLPVRVRVVDLFDSEDEDRWGDCELVKKRFEIRLEAEVLVEDTPYHAVQILFHEWAHALSWGTPTKQDHPDEWGIWYARIYRAYMDEGGYEQSVRLSAHPWR